MTTASVQLDSCVELAEDRRLRDRLRSVGMRAFFCSDTGEIELDTAACAEDWLSRLLQTSSLIARAVRDAVPRWLDQEEPAPIEAVPGLWLAPVSLAGRPRNRLRLPARQRNRPGSGFAVLVLLTDTVLGEGSSRVEHLAALCQSARMDYQSTLSLIAQLPPASRFDTGRVLSLAKFLFEEHLQCVAHDRAMENTGQQLAESYEEISLLYTIIQSMTVVEQPERFVTIACQELLDTLPYGWIGAQLCSDRGRLKQLAGQFFMAGAWPTQNGEETGHGSSPPRLAGSKRSATRPHPLIVKLLRTVQPDVPMVLEPATNEAHAAYRRLGNPVLIHPVMSDGQVIGVLAAGEKHGPDPTANNVDMKLLGAIASHMAIFLENAALYDDLNAMFLGTLEALTASIDAKDRYTCGHSQRVAHLTQQLARAIGLDENVVKRMHIAGLVHDVGKIGVPEELLLKPGKLTDAEFAWIKRHPEIGYRILKDIPQLHDILPGVLYHHERWDGRGYPRGLNGEEIPQVARLIGLADSFDAMSSTRTYRSAMDRRQVLKEIEWCAGTQFDPALVPTFVEMDFREYDRLMIEHRAGGASPGISSAA